MFDEYLDIFIRICGEVDGHEIFSAGAIIIDPIVREKWYQDVIKSMGAGNWDELVKAEIYKYDPISVEEFIANPFYLGKSGVIYPEVQKALIEMCSGKYVEATLTGGIGSGKTSLAHYATAYNLYVLSCLRDPHKLFALDPASEIAIIFQSLNATVAKGVEYNRFRAMCEQTPYFRKVFPFDKNIESKMIFPNRVEVYSVSGAEAAAIGQNIIGGVLDEVNYMSIIEKSKANVDGGTYDQAWALYNSIVRRRKSRFIKNGTMFGLLCLVSSKRFPGQFTDLKEEERKLQLIATGKTDIFLYDKRVWEIKPDGTYDESKFFPVFIGDDSRQPRVLEEGDIKKFSEEDQAKYIQRIPPEYKTDFEKDITNALREIAGVSTLAVTPYFTLVDKVSKCFGTHDSVLNRTSVVLGEEKLIILKKNIVHKLDLRFAHLDLSKNKDATGLTVGHVPGFMNLIRGEDHVETLPIIQIDFSLKILPMKFGEIQYEKVRQILYLLADMGMPISWVTADSYQSLDTLQILKSRGYSTGLQSMDTDLKAYTVLKAALYDGRVRIPINTLLFTELKSLEYNAKKGKVDHTSVSTKDMADSLAGVVYGLSTRRAIWVKHEIPLGSIPMSLKLAIEKSEGKDV